MNNTAEQEKQIGKIKKLLALADSGGAEGMLAFEKATELLRRYQLDEARVRGFRVEDSDIWYEDYGLPSGAGWVQDLISCIAMAFCCRCALTPIWVKKCYSFKQARLFGTASDRTTAKIMFEYAHQTVERLTRSEKIIYGSSGVGSFRAGVVRGMAHTLHEMKKKNSESQGVEQEYALVLRSKEQKVSDLLKKIHPKLRKGGATSVSDMRSFEDGVVAGKNVSFNKQAGAGKAQVLIA